VHKEKHAPVDLVAPPQGMLFALDWLLEANNRFAW